jgi:hypothetical protein
MGDAVSFTDHMKTIIQVEMQSDLLIGLIKPVRGKNL